MRNIGPIYVFYFQSYNGAHFSELLILMQSELCLALGRNMENDPYV